MDYVIIKRTIKEVGDKIPSRVVLYIMSCFGFITSFIMRSDINFTIVAMVRDPERKHVNETHDNSKQYCYDINANHSEDNAQSLKVAEYGGSLDWDAQVQSNILASFYWSYILFQLVGGIATHKFGTKRVFGLAQFVTALCSLSVPWASHTHYGVVIFLRILQGCASGLTWPAMYSILGHWVPISERSRFLSLFQGCNIGIGLTYLLCGFIIASLGWQAVFYTTGSIGMVWCVLWYYLVFDSPETHPRISLTEKQYIKENTVNTYQTARAKSVPWFKIVTSLPVWAIAITNFGRIWVHSTFTIPGPQYMKNVLGFRLEKNGLLSGAPYISCYFTSLMFCYIADKLVARRMMSLTKLRQVFTAIAQVLPACLVLAIPYLECDINMILVCWFTALMLISAAYGGSMANPIDIAPNFAGPVLGVVQFVSMSAGFLSTQVTMYIIKNEQTLSTWRTVFNVCGMVAIATYMFYFMFGNARIQDWNDSIAASSSTENQKIIRDDNSTNLQDSYNQQSVEKIGDCEKI